MPRTLSLRVPLPLVLAAACAAAACATSAAGVLAHRSAPLVGCHEEQIITQNERHQCTQGRYHSWEALCNHQVYYCSNMGDLSEAPDTEASVGSHLHSTVREDKTQDVCSLEPSKVECPKVAADDHPGGLDTATTPGIFQNNGNQGLGGH